MALIGLSTVINNLNIEIAKIQGRTLGGVLYAAELVRIEAMDKAPVVTGNLRASAFVAWGRGIENPNPRFKTPPGKKGRGWVQKMKTQHADVTKEEKAKLSGANCTATVGFSAVYATRTHENPRSGKTGGVSPTGRKYKPGTYATVGEWKFLENAIKDNVSRILDIIRKRAQIP